jgi:signal peptidase II
VKTEEQSVMSHSASGRRGFGAFTGLGLSVAAMALLVDQAHKWWMLHVYRIGEGQKVELAPFFHLVLIRNKGVSYGLLPQETEIGQWLLAVFAVVAVIFMAAWLIRSTSVLPALSLGLIMGGALGNALDRLIHGAVADFFWFHWGSFTWYVFNVADITIVAGIIGLVYDLLIGGHKRVPNTP